MATDFGEKDPDLLRFYLDDVMRHPLLNRADEQRLGRSIQDGRAAAEELRRSPPEPGRRRALEGLVEEGNRSRETFVRANLRLVVSVAKRYQASNAALLDLIQDGNLGLLHAVERFDHRKGFKFSTYATWWIRQAIGRGIADGVRTIRLPVDVRSRVQGVLSTQDRLRAELGRMPTVDEVARDLALRPDQVTEALQLAAIPLSISQSLGDDTDAVLGDMIDDATTDPAEEALAAILPAEIARLLAPLRDREQRILWLRFGLDRGTPRTLEEVGERLALTKERIRQIESLALCKLRHPSLGTDARGLLLG